LEFEEFAEATEGVRGAPFDAALGGMPAGSSACMRVSGAQ
jgi:hypothetical protein